MNPGLTYLLRTSVRGFFRRAGRRMRTPRGLVSTLFGALLFLMVVGWQVLPLLGDGPPARDHPVTVLTVSLVLLVLLVPALIAVDAPFFWPQEVQFLFPAPLTRRDLLLYYMMRSGWLQAFSGLWVGLMGMQVAVHPVAGVLAGVLAMVYLLTLTNFAGLLKLAIGDRLPSGVRAGVKPALALAAFAAGFAFYRRTREIGFGPAAGEAFASPWLHVVTLPTRPVGEAFAARTWGEALLWMGVCVGLTVGAGAASVALRVDFRERSLVSSARHFERMRRTRGARAEDESAPRRARRRLPVPTFGFLGAAAPLARRQAYELGRGLQILGGPLFTAGMVLFYVVVMPMDAAPATQLGAMLVVLAVAFPLVVSTTFSIDFRRDMERMAYLRSLPVRPMTVAVGQVFTAAAVIAGMNVVLLACAAALAGWRVAPEMALMAAAGAIPGAWLAVTLENWLFLLFPTRMQADGRQPNVFMGKHVMKMLFKTLVLLLVVVAAAGVALLAGWLGGPWAAAAGVVLVALLACAGATGLLARAFSSFDLTVDAPG